MWSSPSEKAAASGKKKKMSGARLDSLSLKEMVKATDIGEIASSLETQFRRTLADVSKKKALQSLGERVREYVLIKDKHLSHRDTRMKILKSRLVHGGFCSTLSD